LAAVYLYLWLGVVFFSISKIEVWHFALMGEAKYLLHNLFCEALNLEDGPKTFISHSFQSFCEELLIVQFQIVFFRFSAESIQTISRIPKLLNFGMSIAPPNLLRLDWGREMNSQHLHAVISFFIAIVWFFKWETFLSVRFKLWHVKLSVRHLEEVFLFVYLKFQTHIWATKKLLK